MSILEPTSETAQLAGLRPRAEPAGQAIVRRRWRALAPVADAVVLTIAVAGERFGGRAIGADTMSVGWIVGFPVIAIALLTVGGLYRERLRVQLLDDFRTIAG